MSVQNRNVRCEFGILNLAGLMSFRQSSDDSYAEVHLPLFAHESYKIKTTFNRNIRYIDLDTETEKTSAKFGKVAFEDTDYISDVNYYQKHFRRNVLWDFGDGTKVEGYGVEHYYKKPGRYKITCTFFDINNQGWTNTYKLFVEVKDVIPTNLRFSEKIEDTKTEIFCSKIERLTRIEALLAKNVEHMNILPIRNFSNEDLKEGKEKSYFEVKDNKNYHFEKYYTFYENTQELFLNTRKVYSSYIKPVEIFKPNYQDIYGRFVYNTDTDTPKLELRLYEVIPYKTVDEEIKHIRLLNPNKNILDGIESDFYIDVEITHLYLDSYLPSDVSIVGRRAFVDIFYKNDNISKYTSKNGKFTFEKDNNFTFCYDVENQNIEEGLVSSTNYLNIIPLMMNVAVKINSLENVKVALSLNGFLKSFDEKKIENTEKFYVDPYFDNSYSKNYNIEGIFCPFILYTNKDSYVIDEIDSIDISEETTADFVCEDAMYYIPKDISLRIDVSRVNDDDYGVNSNSYEIKDDCDRTFITHFFEVKDYLSHEYTFILKNKISNTSLSSRDNEYKNMILVDNKTLVIPKQKEVNVDVDRLINVYLQHPCFDDAENLKSGLVSIFKNNNFLNYILTKSENFLDDKLNIRTCYLSNLISMMTMMGEDVTTYESSSFEGINELRDLVRILSMNHNDLIGHTINDYYDITIRYDNKGENVGDKITPKDRVILYNNPLTTGVEKTGLIKGYNRYHNDGFLPLTRVKNIGGTNLIAQDNYTFETKIVSFANNSILKYATLNQNNEYQIFLNQYSDEWGWNLLLPKRYKSATDELKKSTISPSKRADIIKSCEDILNGYYSFYLLNPTNKKRRVGNFLDESTIYAEIDSVEEWEKAWGIIHNCIMKIIVETMGLQD